jgi:hypothetical protein
MVPRGFQSGNGLDFFGFGAADFVGSVVDLLSVVEV